MGEPTTEEVWDFNAYFDVADELEGGLTLADLDPKYVAMANAAAHKLGLPWPPELSAAEDFSLDHSEYR